LINYTAFEQKIIERNLRAIWRDGIFSITEKDRDLREKEKYIEAKKKYESMLSPSNNGRGVGYYKWALNESLGITSYKARFRKSRVVAERL